MSKTIPVCTIDLKDINSESNKEILMGIPQELLIEFLLMEIERIDKAIEYINENEKEYGSLEENEKIILNILKGEE